MVLKKIGFFGKVQIAVFQNPEKQNEQSPDATIHLFVEDWRIVKLTVR